MQSQLSKVEGRNNTLEKQVSLAALVCMEQRRQVMCLVIAYVIILYPTGERFEYQDRRT